MDSPARKRVLIFIVAYNAERKIEQVIDRIPRSLAQFDTHILIIDDSSKDRTFELAHRYAAAPFPMTVLFNPVNQGYGGNQKIGFHYALREGFDYVALVHGDGQYAPECLPQLLQPLVDGEADAVFGSRMMGRTDALKGGMPLYKFVGNRTLTGIQNRLLGTKLSEFHSGYRLYSVEALRAIPFDLNTNDFHFDTEIIIQLVRWRLRIKELPIPTFYGDEKCHVNGMKYAVDVTKATLLSRAQDFGILYDRKYDTRNCAGSPPLYQVKWGYESPHTVALDLVPRGSRVLDVGCADGHIAEALADRGCEVTGVDQYPPVNRAGFARFIQADLNRGDLPLDTGKFQYILLLDIIEHLVSPEKFVDWLRRSRRSGDETKLIVSTGNIGFAIPRLMLLLGNFNYSSRGILDLTHTRLFTFATLRNLFLQAGYRIELERGIPAPFPLAFGDSRLARFLLAVNRFLIRISKGWFSYQIFMVVRPMPTLEYLLQAAKDTAADKAAQAN